MLGRLQKLVDAMLPILEKAIPPGAPPMAIQQTMAMFKDPQTGQALLLKEPGKLFALHCVGGHEGLVIAEIELPSLDTEFEQPDWIGEEVTDDPRYSNQWMSIHGIPG